MEGLRVEHPSDGVALVTLTRPDRMNALDDDLLLRILPDTFADLANDSSVRAVVVTGEGRGFCAGADLDCSGFSQPTPLEAAEFTARTHRTPVNVRRLPQPTIAAVNGAALAHIGDAIDAEIDGGSVARDGVGRPSGLLEERAQSLVQSLVLPRSLETLARAEKSHAGRFSKGLESVS